MPETGSPVVAQSQAHRRPSTDFDAGHLWPAHGQPRPCDAVGQSRRRCAESPSLLVFPLLRVTPCFTPDGMVRKGHRFKSDRGLIEPRFCRSSFAFRPQTEATRVWS